MDELPDVLEEALARIIAAERKEWIRERERIETDARAILAELRAENALLKTALEMQRIDDTRRINEALERVSTTMALVKDGERGEKGEPGESPNLDDIVAKVLERVPHPKDGRDGVQGECGEKGEPGEIGPRGEKGDAGAQGEPGEKGDEGRGVVGLTIDNESGELWASYSDGFVERVGLARGPQGEKGATGEKGDIGEAGPQGEKGEAGEQGLAGPQGERGQDGKDADPELIARLVDETITRSIAALPPPERGEKGDSGDKGERGEQGVAGEPGRDGKDADPELIIRLVDESINKAVAALPPPERGEKGERGEQGERGQDGKDADPEFIVRLVDESIIKAVATLPPPEPGEKGERGDRGERGEKGDPGIDGRDGVGIAGAFRGYDGNLVLTLSDGTVRELGIVNGKDGEPGKDGRDGKDGISFDDFQLAADYDGERTVTLKVLSKGKEQAWPVRMPITIYRGIYKPDVEYEAGDMCTFAGCCWIAQANTSEKPGNGSTAWRLAVKAGRDGRDGAPGAKGEKGDVGPMGPARLVTGNG